MRPAPQATCAPWEAHLRTFVHDTTTARIDDPPPHDPARVAAYTKDVAHRLSTGWTEVVEPSDALAHETWPDGRLKARGPKRGDQRVGEWLEFFAPGGLQVATGHDDAGRRQWVRYYREDGTLQEIQDHTRHDDGRIWVDVYGPDGATVVRRGTWALGVSWDGQAVLLFHGEVEEVATGVKQTWDLGQLVAAPAAPDLTGVLAAWRAPDVVEAIAPTLWQSVDAIRVALAESRIEIDGALAVKLVARCYETTRDALARAVAPHARDLRPALDRAAAELRATQFPSSELASAAALLWLAHDPANVDPDVLVAAAHTASGIGPTVSRLTAALLAQPVEVRERAAIRFDQPDWRWVKHAPTPAVVAAAVAALGKLDKKAFTYAREREGQIEDALTALAPALADAVVDAWAAGGSKHPQRRLYALALARSGSRSVVPTLVAMAGDALDPVRLHAAEGLAALATEEELAQALTSRKVATRETAARALATRTTESARALARAHAARETDPQVLAALEPPAAQGDPAAELRGAAAALDFAALEARHAALAQPYYFKDVLRQLVHRQPAWAVVVTDRILASLAEGKDGKVLGLEPYGVGWLRSTSHPARFALGAAIVAASAESKGVSASGPELFRAMNDLGDDGLRALAARLRPELVDAKRLKRLLETWVETSPATGVALFAEGLGASAKVARDLCVQGLVAAGADAVPAVWPKLSGGPDAVAAAAAILARFPDPRSVAPLEAALAAARAPTVREAIEAALGACRTTAAPAAQADYAALDADLAGRKVRGAPAVQAPVVRWRDGTALSDGAVGWILATARKEDTNTRSTELARVCGSLEPSTAASLLAAVQAAFPEEPANKWVRYARGLLGDDAALDALGAGLASDVARTSAAWAGHGVEALRRRASPTAIRWLDHWSTHAPTPKLGSDAREALAALAAEHGVDRDVLVDRSLVGAPAAAVLARLEAAMITGRRWSAEAFDAVVLGTGHADGLVAAIYDDDRPATLFRITGRSASAPLTGTIGIPHPVELDDAQLRAFIGGKPGFRQLDRPFTRDPGAAIDAFTRRSVAPRTFVQRADQLGLRQGAPEDAGMVYEVSRRIGTWRVSYGHDGYAAADKQNPNGSKIKSTGVSFRSDDDRWDPPTDGLASEAVQDLKALFS